MPKKFVYQLSVRKPDEDIKKFRIETDTIYSESELTEEQLKVISEKNKCDLFVQYIGYLVEPKKPQERIQIMFHTEQDIQDYIDKWNKKVEA